MSRRLLSRRLWFALCNPPAHSHIYVQSFHQRDKPIIPADNSLASSLVFLLVMVSGGAIVPVVMFWAVSLYYGGALMWRVLDATHRYRFFGHGTLDTTPPGRVGVLVHTAMGILHRRQRLNTLRDAPFLIVRCMLAVLTFSVLMSALPANLRPTGAVAFFGLIAVNVWLFILAVYMFQSYAIISGLLIGLIAATYPTARPLLHGMTVAVYVVLQLATTLVFVLLAGRFAVLLPKNVLLVPLVIGGGFGCVVGVSECVVRGLWYMLMYRLGQPQIEHILTPSA